MQNLRPWPRIPSSSAHEMEKLFSTAADDIWTTGEVRNGQLHILKYLSQHVPSGDVLDVGCYDGSLLAAAGTQYGEFGVEAPTKAAAIARRRGVKIVADRFSELELVSQCFQAICAVDVIEHALNPPCFLTWFIKSSRCRRNNHHLHRRIFGISMARCTEPILVLQLTGAGQLRLQDWALCAAPQCGLEFLGAARFSHGAGYGEGSRDACA